MGKNMAVINNNTISSINYYSDLEVSTPTLIDVSDRPVQIGDSYIDGKFYREGKEILTQVEEIQQILNDSYIELTDTRTALRTIGIGEEDGENIN